MRKEKVYIAEGGSFDGYIFIATSMKEPEFEIGVSKTLVAYASLKWLQIMYNTKIKFIGYL